MTREEEILISISRRGDSLSEVAAELLDGNEADEFDPAVVDLCKLLHIPPTKDVVKISKVAIQKLIQTPSDVYAEYIDDLAFDNDKADEFYRHYLNTLGFDTVKASNIDYMFGVPSVFNKSHEENYGCARALLQLYGDRSEDPTLWKSIVTFRGRVLDAD